MYGRRLMSKPRRNEEPRRKPENIGSKPFFAIFVFFMGCANLPSLSIPNAVARKLLTTTAGDQFFA
jgi:hypothetical protein